MSQDLEKGSYRATSPIPLVQRNELGQFAQREYAPRSAAPKTANPATL